MASLSRAKKIINQEQKVPDISSPKPKHTIFKKVRHGLALTMFAGFVSIVSIILWEKATLKETVQHGSSTIPVSLDTITNTYSQFAAPGATWRFDTTRWQQVDVDALWRYDKANDIGIELETYPSEVHDAMTLPNIVMNEIRMHKPEALFVGHEFIYKNGLVGFQLIYDAQHNGERQRYVGEYFSTPTHRVSLVAFTPVSKYPTNLGHIRQALLGLQPLRSPQEVNESLRWIESAEDNEQPLNHNDDQIEKLQTHEQEEQQSDGLQGATAGESGDLPSLIDPNIWSSTTSDDLLLPHAISHKNTNGILKRGVRQSAQSIASFAQSYRLVLQEDGATITYTDEDITDAGYLLITFENENDRVPLKRMILLYPHTQGIFLCHFETLTTLFDDAKDEAKTACNILIQHEKNTQTEETIPLSGTINPPLNDGTMTTRTNLILSGSLTSGDQHIPSYETDLLYNQTQ
ncbi:MAG: hypothetical protein NZL83_01565 [Candidatus Absconditabacterales bacterium]|nr:hypothetical protein [Candidatus Absconditabacterales bacterium]